MCQRLAAIRQAVQREHVSEPIAAAAIYCQVLDSIFPGETPVFPLQPHPLSSDQARCPSTESTSTPSVRFGCTHSPHRAATVAADRVVSVDYEFVNNWKVLQKVFDAQGVKKVGHGAALLVPFAAAHAGGLQAGVGAAN